MAAPRDPETGQFKSRECPDPNCDGYLVRAWDSFDNRHFWRCNGLTHETRDGPLISCNETAEE